MCDEGGGGGESGGDSPISSKRSSSSYSNGRGGDSSPEGGGPSGQTRNEAPAQDGQPDPDYQAGDGRQDSVSGPDVFTENTGQPQTAGGQAGEPGSDNLGGQDVYSGQYGEPVCVQDGAGGWNAMAGQDSIAAGDSAPDGAAYSEAGRDQSAYSGGDLGFSASPENSGGGIEDSPAEGTTAGPEQSRAPSGFWAAEGSLGTADRFEKLTESVPLDSTPSIRTETGTGQAWMAQKISGDGAIDTRTENLRTGALDQRIDFSEGSEVTAKPGKTAATGGDRTGGAKAADKQERAGQEKQGPPAPKDNAPSDSKRDGKSSERQKPGQTAKDVPSQDKEDERAQPEARAGEKRPDADHRPGASGKSDAAAKAGAGERSREPGHGETSRLEHGRGSPGKARQALEQGHDRDVRKSGESGKVSDKSAKPETKAQMFNPSEREKAVKDLKKVTLHGEPFLRGAGKENKSGSVAIVVTDGQLIYISDPRGKLRGDTNTYWTGTSGTNRPATNLPPGTWIIDNATRNVHDACSLGIVGQIPKDYGKSGNRVIAQGEKTLFLPPRMRAPAVHQAFRQALQGDRYLVVRVPDKESREKLQGDQWSKVREALSRSSRFVGGEFADQVKHMAKNPLETALSSLSGKVGEYLFGAQTARDLGTAVAIAKAAQTQDGKDTSARLMARIFAGYGVGKALGAMTHLASTGAKAGVRAIKTRRAAKTGAAHAPGSGTGEKGGPGLEDTRPMPDRKTLETMDTQPMAQVKGQGESGEWSSPGQGRRAFDYYKDTYFKGDAQKAQSMLHNVHEGDLGQALRSAEFRQRFEKYLEAGDGHMTPETARELSGKVDEWYCTYKQDMGNYQSANPNPGTGGHGHDAHGYNLRDLETGGPALELEHGPAQTRAQDFGNIDLDTGGQRLDVYRGQQPVGHIPGTPNTPQHHFGQASDIKTGTHARTGEHFHEYNPAEMSRAQVRFEADAAAGRSEKVSYVVTKEAVDAKPQTQRSFSRDPSTAMAQPTYRDLANTGYDAGHLVQREAAKLGSQVEREVDKMTLVVPMARELNRGPGSPWRASEQRAAAWARELGAVRVEVRIKYGDQKLHGEVPVPKEFRRIIKDMDGTVLEDKVYPNK